MAPRGPEEDITSSQADSQLELRFLGPPQIELDGRMLLLDRRKGLGLLVYLALNDGPQRRDSLATLFWPDHDQRGARGNLRRTLSALNQALDGKWLETDRETAALKRGPGLWVDAIEFRRLLAQGEGHDHAREDVCHQCLKPLAAAAALYRGDFLAGFTLADCPELDDFQLFQAEALQQELSEALKKLARGHGEQGQYRQAIEFGRRRLAGSAGG